MNRARLLTTVLSGGGRGWVTPTDVTAGEAAALKALYDATGGATWTNKTNWGQTATANDWYGIDTLGGHLTWIGLNSNNLVGSLTGWNPTASFPYLEDLYLNGNASLTGNIAAWRFGDCANFEALNLSGTGLSGDIGSWTWPSATVSIAIFGMAGITGDISGWTLPANLQNIRLYSTNVSGDISGWTIPTGSGGGLTSFQIHATDVTGDISGWTIPATMQYFYIYGTGLSGVPNISALTAIREIAILDCGLSQANIDAWMLALYNRRAAFTYATPSMLAQGTNAAPSGTYQDGDPPDTGKEYIYELKLDPEAEGFRKWSIAYTGSP